MANNKIPVLKVKDANGEFQFIPALTGPPGPRGIDGQRGADGPNIITQDTSTPFSGLLKGNGDSVTVASAVNDYTKPNCINVVEWWKEHMAQPGEKFGRIEDHGAVINAAIEYAVEVDENRHRLRDIKEIFLPSFDIDWDDEEERPWYNIKTPISMRNIKRLYGEIREGNYAELRAQNNEAVIKIVPYGIEYIDEGTGETLTDENEISNVTIEGFYIYNLLSEDGVCVVVEDATDITLRNMIIEDANRAILMQNSSGIKIEDCMLTLFKYGIYINDCWNVDIINAYISTSDDPAIVLDNYSSEIKIDNCYLNSSSGRSINDISYCDYIIITNNNFQGTIPAISVSGKDVEIKNNNFSMYNSLGSSTPCFIYYKENDDYSGGYTGLYISNNRFENREPTFGDVHIIYLFEYHDVRWIDVYIANNQTVGANMKVIFGYGPRNFDGDFYTYQECFDQYIGENSSTQSRKWLVNVPIDSGSNYATIGSWKVVEIDIYGITQYDDPIIKLHQGNVEPGTPENEALINEFAKICRIDIYYDKIRVFTKESITISIPITVQTVYTMQTFGPDAFSGGNI